MANASINPTNKAAVAAILESTVPKTPAPTASFFRTATTPAGVTAIDTPLAALRQHFVLDSKGNLVADGALKTGKDALAAGTQLQETLKKNGGTLDVSLKAGYEAQHAQHLTTITDLNQHLNTVRANAQGALSELQGTVNRHLQDWHASLDSLAGHSGASPTIPAAIKAHCTVPASGTAGEMLANIAGHSAPISLGTIDATGAFTPNAAGIARAKTASSEWATRMHTTAATHFNEVNENLAKMTTALKAEEASAHSIGTSLLGKAAPSAAIVGSGGVAAAAVQGEKGFIGAAKYAELEGKPIARYMQDVKSNFKSGWVGTAKTAVGLGAVVYAGLDAAKQVGNFMSTDEEKRADASLVKLAVDIGLIAGGGYLARHGGKAIATGVAI